MCGGKMWICWHILKILLKISLSVLILVTFSFHFNFIHYSCSLVHFIPFFHVKKGQMPVSVFVMM